LPKHSHPSLSDQLLEKLEGMILDGALKPGDHIRENMLAETWGVSRAPIREACRILQRAGLVEIVTNKGAFVRQVSLQHVLHLFDIRGALWRLAAREATLNMTRRHSDHLEDLIRQIDAVVSQNDDRAFLILNTEFHDAILRLTHNEPLLQLQRDLFQQARLFRRRALLAQSHLAERNEDHRRILSAMRAGDAEEAGRISEEHVLKSKQHFCNALGATVDPISDIIQFDGSEDEDKVHGRTAI
jgi:DNA-binding GntR family transcriptional regulator